MNLIRKYKVLLKAEWAVMLAYRSESAIWMLGMFVQPLISLAVWLSINEGGTTGGFSNADFIRYFAGVLLVERLTRSWDVWELDADIRKGTISAKILRPVHPVHWSISANIVYKLFFASVMIPSWLLISLFVEELRLPLGGWQLLLFFASIVLSSAIRFLIGYQFGILAFWTNRATAIYLLFDGISLFLAGRIAPLHLFPEWISQLARIFPFYVMTPFPVELLMGRTSAENIGWGFVSQIAWLAVLYAAFRVQWRAGLKKYGAVGG